MTILFDSHILTEDNMCRVSDEQAEEVIEIWNTMPGRKDNGCRKSIPVMIQGITSAFCIRILVSVFMSKLPNTSLMMVGLATPITTVYGIIFFLICFAWLKRTKKEREKCQRQGIIER